MLLCIANPAANRGGSRALQRQLQTLAQTDGATWAETRYPRHATELAAHAGMSGIKAVVAIGGDGTVHEVVNGLMQSPPAIRPALSVLPSGTGNDFALGAGLVVEPMAGLKALLSVRDWELAADTLVNPHSTSPKIRTIDVGVVQDENGKREYWDNTLGIGFDAAANLQARRITNLRGFPMYLLAVVRTIAHHFHAANAEMWIDDVPFNQAVMMLTLGNGPREGGGFITTPASKMDDGLLDFAMVQQLSRWQMLQLLPKVMSGTHIHSQHVRMGQLKTLHLKLDRPLPIHIDGEVFSTDSSHELNISIIPAAIRVVDVGG
ncbi:MAG: YegS/Rv2252/BmrU family lipid kinase [Anaerolineae bacterium]|nr:YegS/Rv2252/BmrU family lipid kinase [Anaerolineae bacterium]